MTPKPEDYLTPITPELLGPYHAERTTRKSWRVLRTTNGKLDVRVVANVHCEEMWPSDADRHRAMLRAQLFALSPALYDAVINLLVCPDLNLDSLEPETYQAIRDVMWILKEIRGGD